MATGLIALLDDVAGIAKLAAASLDDATGQAARASGKAAGVVIDDTAVTPNYVVGFAAERELPIIGKIALGSFRNKLLHLLPIALVLSLLAPWAITPLLMLGGAYLCFEGAEKVYEKLAPHADEDHPTSIGAEIADPRKLEKEKVKGAIRTDFILSAEIMAITLASVAEAGFATRAFVLAVVGVGITILVYGVVALIVKADDVGLSLSRNERPVTTLFGFRRAVPPAPPSGGDRRVAPLTCSFGRGLVHGMPHLLDLLGIVGTAAMIWVGGGIVLHGIETYGFTLLPHAIHHAAEQAAHAAPAARGFVEWAVSAIGSGIFGLILGGIIVAVLHLIPSHRR